MASSPPTTTNTGIPGSAGTPRHRCTTAPPSRSASNARPPSTRPTPRTPTGSTTGHTHPNSPTKRGSTSQPSRHRPSQFDLTTTEEHRGRVWPLIVGQSGLGRKGTAVSVIQKLMWRIDPEYMRHNRVSGLSSSEGLIRLVCDPDDKELAVSAREAEEKGETFDPGIAVDKRKLIVESEFASVLGRTRREGNTLSSTVRDAYDNT